MINNYSIQELVDLTKDLRWRSAALRSGIQLGKIKAPHLKRAIYYLGKNLDEKSHLRKYSNSVWLMLLSLHLLNQDSSAAIPFTVNELQRAANSFVANNILIDAAPTISIDATPTTPKTFITARLDSDKAKQFKALAANNNVAMQDLAGEVLERYLAPATISAAVTSTQKQYIYFSREDRRYFVGVGVQGIFFTDNITRAQLLAPVEIQVLTSLLGAHITAAFKTLTSPWYVMKKDLFLCYDNGAVGWTNYQVNAAAFDDQPAAAKVVEALYTLFGTKGDSYSIVNEVFKSNNSKALNVLRRDFVDSAALKANIPQPQLNGKVL